MVQELRWPPLTRLSQPLLPTLIRRWKSFIELFDQSRIDHNDHGIQVDQLFDDVSGGRGRVRCHQCGSLFSTDGNPACERLDSIHSNICSDQIWKYFDQIFDTTPKVRPQRPKSEWRMRRWRGLPLVLLGEKSRQDQFCPRVLFPLDPSWHGL